MLFKLAFRNVFRNIKRTAITFSAIAVGLMLLILMDSFLTGVSQDSYKKIIDFETGHLKIFSKGYRADMDNYPLDKDINNPAMITTKVMKESNVAGVTSRLNFRMTLSNGIDNLPAVGMAIDPDKDENVFFLKKSIVAGSFLNADDNAMLLGADLAKDFNVKVGDTLTLLTRTKYNTYQALDLTVKGILATQDNVIDSFAVVVPLSLMQKSLEMGGEVTEIDIKLKNAEALENFKDQLARDITGVEIATYKDLSEDLQAISQTKQKFSSILLLSILFVAFIGIANTILLAAFERVKEIGTMAALGMKRRQIILLFVMEGGVIGLLGSVVGCLLGTALVLGWAANTGVDFSFMHIKDLSSYMGGYRMTTVMYGAWNPDMVIKAFFFGILASILSSIYPAWLASKMQPTEALRKN